MSETAVEIPGYVAGTWNIDPVHSEVSFVVRHMMVSKVRGRFDKFEGTITTAPDPLASTVTADVDLSSMNTGNETQGQPHPQRGLLPHREAPRDDLPLHRRAPDGDNFLLAGDLTSAASPSPVTFKLEMNGFGPDPYGGTRAGFSATTEINRNDWNVSYNGPIPGASGGPWSSATRSRSTWRSRPSWPGRIVRYRPLSPGPGPRHVRGPGLHAFICQAVPAACSAASAPCLPGSRGTAAAAPRPRRPCPSRSRRRAARSPC